MRKLRKSTIAPSMLVELEFIFIEMGQIALLSSSHNNKTLTSCPIISHHYTVGRCTGDADTIFVFTVLDHACIGGNVELTAADTDLLIMFLCFWDSLIGEITMNSEATKKQLKVISVTLKTVSAMLQMFDVGSYFQW